MNFRALKVLIDQQNVGAFLWRTETFIEIEGRTIPLGVELSRHILTTQAISISGHTSEFRGAFRRFHKYRYVPAVTQLWPLKKRPIDNKNAIGWGQLRFLFDRLVIFEIKGLCAIKTITVRPQWNKQQLHDCRQITCIVIITFSRIAATSIALGLWAMKAVN